MLSVGEMLVFKVSPGHLPRNVNDAAQVHDGRYGFRRDFDMRKHVLKMASLLSVALAVAFFAPQRAASR